MLQEILLIVGYFLAYGVLGGIHNGIILTWTGLKTEKRLHYSGGYVACMKYARAVQDAWFVKMISNPQYRPMIEVMCILLWPLYLPAAAITSVVIAKKYLKITDDLDF